MRAHAEFLVKAVLSLGGAWLALSCAAAASEPAPGRDRAAISGGQLDSKDSSVFLLVSHRGTAGVAQCSASLIAPNLLLTARHCVAEVPTEQVTCGQTMAGPPLPVNTLFAANSPSEAEIMTAYRVSSVSVPSEGSDICGFDLALVTLSTSVPAEVATPLVPRVDRPVSAREPFSAVGYGLDSPGDAGVAGVRRARSGLTVSCTPGNCGVSAEPNEFVGGAGICSGDSGGPALDQAGQVVGVASRSGDTCGAPVYGAVASWKDWLISVARQAAEQGNYPVPAWATSDGPDAAPNSGSGGGSGAVDPPTEAAGSNALGTPAGSGTQGSECAGPEACQSGFACFSPSGTALGAYCAALCSEQAQCGAGSSCQVRLGVCVSNASTQRATSSSSCAVSEVGRFGGASGVAALTGFALVLVRRRQARTRRR